MKGKRFILRLMVLLLMAGGMVNSAWATDVTYHILTLPINPSVYDYHMKPAITGWRLEAVKVVAKGQSTLELPAEYKSPLATGFTYYAATDANIVKYNSGAAQNLFANGPIKGVLYQIKGVDNDDTPAATPVAEGTELSGNEYYVVYTYNASNTIAQLDGSVKYNIHTKYKDNGTFKDKGFFALNRGRNNRPAILPTANVDPEMLSTEDFIKASVDGTSIGAYWKDNNNKNDEKLVGGQFFFGFKFEGEDPYNIIIRTTYAKDTTYIEKNDGTNNFVYKWYKEGSLFVVSSGNNFYIASDEHRRYTTAWVSGNPNPTNPAYEDRHGNYHGQTGVVWNSFTLLNNSSNDGYVFMGTRTVDGSGAIQNNLYYLKEKDNYNNLNFATGNSTDNLTIEGIYPIEKVTFKIATPFYDPESPSDAHIISVEDQVSKYTVDHDQIETKYLPAALKRKYISFNGNFYKDAACTQKITYFSDATKHATEGYQVYVGYDVSSAAPKFISPSASYTTATWYELTDGESTQEHGRKIKYDDTNEVYKNNGANGEYTKASEFAFVGDPYELKVLYRKGTETAGANRYVTLSTHDTWDMPQDATEGSFLLRKYKDANEGKWAWDAGETSVDVAYGTDDGTPSLDKNAQTVKINISGLNGSKYYKISTGGADASQIESVTPSIDNVSKVPGTTMTIVVQLKENTSGANKVMTVSIQQYDDAEGNTPFGSSSDITITQGIGTSSFAGHTVTYSTTSSTRVKVLNLPKVDISYNVVDKSGRIAVKATAKQTIFSPISLATMPGIIISPFILDETVKFYDDNYVDGAGRNTLTHEVTETSNVADDIFITYTTARLDNKSIKLSEDQEFNVLLNGHYLWYDASDNSVKTDDAPGGNLKSNAYLWKLRNRDPYAMMIDNLAAREDLGVDGNDETVTVYDDAGTGTSATRQKGAWVNVSSIANEGTLIFTSTRADAQQFIAKSSVLAGVYEVMVATGASVDASTTYYNIGCTAENTVKIYDNAYYLHGNDVLKFRLEQTIPYTYHLIDKQNKQLLELTSQSPDLALPGDYQSPLVATYHFYDQDNITISSGTYTVKTPATELTSIYDLNATYDEPTSSTADAYNAAASDKKHEATSVDDMKDKAKALTTTGHHYYKISDSYYDVNITKANYSDIYVTYDVNDVVKFNTGQYMLKFLEPLAEGYHLEDGNDRLTSTKIQAVYPYCNGDGNLNIYGEDMQKEQFHGGASTRPRWVWYFDSENNDPYHVRIRSRSTISYNSVSHNTYLTTYAVHFNQDALASTKHIVTGGTLPGVASAIPTEYMVLGSAGNYKLMTTETVDDGTTNERRKVTSFEQYWKTYNMLKLCVLGINKNTNEYSDDPTTWVVPADKRAELNSQLETLGVGSGNWHSYNAYANATRWNGYNDKSDGSEKKVVENIEHWFQTFTMGNGTFDIESAEIPPVLVLLDLHGWEIMRLPLPTKNYPEGDDELAALRAYDSPLVKEYKFYSQATKATGCHKYTLRMQNGAERDQIKVNGKHYTSTSLGGLPPRSASGVISGGAFNDQFVTYTVKEEYAKSYTYDFTDNGDGSYTESGTPSKFLVLLRSRFFRENTGAANASYFSKPIYEASDPVGGNIYDAILDPCQKTESNVSTNVDENKDGIIDDLNLWYIQPNLNIDKEMGIKWGTSNNINDAEPLSEYGTKKKYKDITGFDPYNIQLRNANDSRFVTSHQTSTNLHDGILIGDYTGSGGTTNMSLEAEHNYAGWDPAVSTGSEGYDHTNLTISNQTFMAVSDANGNMQLMPRFDHTKRVNLVNNSDKSYTTLQAPENHIVASADKNSSMGTQTIFFVRAQRLDYHIINNKGQEALRYRRTGDNYPAITDHFKSPIATDFTYYTGLAEGTDVTCEGSAWEGATGDFKRTLTSASLLTDAIKLLPRAGTYYYRIGTRGSFTYKQVTVAEGEGLLDKQITGSLAAAGLTGYDCEIQVRYKYDANADHDADRVLEGKWFTAKLADKDLQADGTVVVPTGSTQGTGVNLYAGNDKPATIDEDDKKWQWKFLAAPADSISDYYEAPDPYDILIFNRHANYTTDPSANPSPMAVGIKVPNATSGANHFALLSHSEGGYALAVTGLQNYTYKFLNGASMTIPSTTAANIVTETDFKQKAGIFSGIGSQLILNDDVKHQFTYRVINNANILSVSASQNNEEADAHEFFPHLPESAQTPLLNDSDYLYYGFARSAGEGKTAVIEQTILYTLYGLYDDIVFVRYNAYDMDKTSFKVPNMRNETGTGQVARNPSSIDVAMNINGGLPYNIIWYSDNMMKAIDSNDDSQYDAINDGGSHTLSGDPEFIWYFTGNDPYALKIKHKGGSYANGTGTLVAEGSAPTFMLLKKTGYDYGILQKTGLTDRLSGYGQTTVTTDPTKYILFGLSIHDLKYHLIIAKTCPDKSDPQTGEYVDIPYRVGDESTYQTSGTWTASDVKRIYGTTQRDLTSVNTGEGTHVAGEKYQLGTTETWNGQSYTYCKDVGPVSIGDELVVPNEFLRPNCTFEFYIEGVYHHGAQEGQPYEAMNNKYKGLKLDKLMSDEQLIDQNVVVNIVYSFDQDVATNTGLGFVTSTDQNLWYTFETQSGATPYLAHYTNAWGLQSMAGRETRYTNDYIWTPLGDVYGFKMYNRYMLKNSGGVHNVMTMDGITEGKNLLLAEPGTGDYTSGNEIFELLTGDQEGYFRVHPVINNSGTQYYVRRDPSDNYTKLSTTPCDWRFGLEMDLLEPYYERAGYVGGLTADGKTAYEAAVASGLIINIQNVVYNDANIVHYTPGYYRMHSQPGVSGISPVRYASGYLHDIEKTHVSGGIPMHFFSREGVSAIFDGAEDDLNSGFTETPATRGDVPIDPTEYDPSTIFYFNGNTTLDGNPRSTMQTQGLYVAANPNGDANNGTTTSKKQRAVMSDNSANAITFSLMDIGGAVLLIHDGAAPATRRYLNYDQSNAADIYDLKYYHDSPTDDAKWCLKPVQKTGTAGNGEMPLQIATHNGGDGYYYATFYAPFDVLLPADGGGATYNAYTCSQWYNDGVHPVEVPATNDYLKGKFVPAGTPVIIRVKDESGTLTLTLPSTSPSTPVSCVFKGSYLEKLLPVDASNDVYTLGVPFISDVEKDADYEITGDITAPLPEFATSGVGFYINATYNKESDPMQSLWQRNNRYVLHNKIYYRAGDRAEAPLNRNSTEYVPVIFGDDDPDAQSQQIVGNTGAYDILGRKVASEQEVQSGTWSQHLNPGVYIVNGQKIYLAY